MLKNYFRVAIRNIKRNTGYSLINILGLAGGLVCLIFILLYIKNELSYDTFQENSDRVYRLSEHLNFRGKWEKVALSAPIMGPEMVSEFPEVDKAARVVLMTNRLISTGEKKFDENVQFVDRDAVSILSINVVEGNPELFLAQKYTAALSESVAERLFGETNPIGQIVRLDNQMDLTVTGVFRDYPRNSHLRFDILISLETLTDLWGSGALTSKNSNNFFTFLLLSEQAGAEALEAKFPDFVSRHYGDQGSGKVRPFLEPLSDIYLHSDAIFGTGTSGNIYYVYLLLIIAFAVLATAGVNFVNLTTAQSMKRAREIGVRKVCGSSRASLIRQFLSESVVLSLIAFLIALGVVELLMPAFNNLVQRELTLSLAEDPWFFAMLAGIVLGAGLLSGSYPAVFLSSFRPVQVLKGTLKAKPGGTGLRRALVVFQFTSSVILIICSLLVYRQLNYLQNKDIGYARENIFFVPLRSPEAKKNGETFKNELLQQSSVKNASLAWRIMGDAVGEYLMTSPPHSDTTAIKVLFVDEDFLETFDLELAAGRNFSEQFSTDTRAFLVNRRAAKLLGDNNILGREVELLGEYQGKVIGVLDDFNYQSLHSLSEPLLIARTKRARYLAVRTEGGQLRTALSAAENAWQQHFPADIFDFTILDQHLDNLYKSEQRLGKLVLIFTVLAIGIACLGLFGLIAFTVQQRKKEIGIRKVLGSKVSGVVFTMTKDLLSLVLIGSLVACPIAWLLMNSWLQDFAYRIDIEWWVFLTAGCAALVIAFLTMSTQVVKAALANPVESLRYE